MKHFIITIDGPAGSGKTTVSRILANRLGYKYIDTGALYRGVAFEANAAGLNPDDETALEKLCGVLNMKITHNEDGIRFLSNSLDITEQIRTPEIAMLASQISAKYAVRKYLTCLQRDMGKEGNVVFEGRDMGTVVFPHADVKFFMDASCKTRALRRYKELTLKTSITLENIEKDIKLRDKNDSNRKLSPLKPAKDAIIINSTEISAKEVVDIMLKICLKTSKKK